MSNKFKGPLTALMVSSLAIVPAATIAYVAMADVAFAKSDKAGGNGNGKGGSAKSSAGGSKGNSGTKSASSSSGGGKSRGHGGLDNFFQKLTGKDKAKSAKSKSTTNSAKLAAAPKERPLTYGKHPSELGKMNGALNANVNALIAHVKNGNTNGPIGGMAALAIAGYAAEGAEETLRLYEDFASLDQLLIDNDFVDENGDPDLQAYLDALEGVEGGGPIDAIESALAEEEGALSIEEALLGASNLERDFTSVEDYEAWRDGVERITPIEGAAELIEATDGQERPDDEDAEYAEGVIEDRTSAEDYMLSIWNKGDGDDSARSDEEKELLEILYQRIENDGEALTNAIKEYADLPEPPADEPVEGEEVTECSGDESECSASEQEIATAN